jgi:hypothetical protein
VRLIVYFDGQFWCGVFEEDTAAGLCAFRHVFGAEPRDTEVLAVARGLRIDALPLATAEGGSVPRPANPKRRAREAARAVRETGIGTRSQQALKRARETEAELRRKSAQGERERRREDLRALKRARALKRHQGH